MKAPRAGVVALALALATLAACAVGPLGEPAVRRPAARNTGEANRVGASDPRGAVDVPRTPAPRLRARLAPLAAEVVPGRASGLVVAVVRPGRRHVLAFGSTADTSGVAPDERTLFEIGSVTKTFTGVMLARLVLDEGARLDEPIDDLVAPHPMPHRDGRAMTLLDLATHTSGLPRIPYDAPPNLGAAVAYDADHMVRFLATHALAFAPGARYAYSNLGVGLLGHALARRTGATYEAWITEHVCAPLDMPDTRITLDAARARRLAVGRAFDPRDPPNLEWPADSASLASGALKSTALDLIHYLEAHLGERPSDLDEAIALAARPHRATATPGESMGLLWLIHERADGTRDVTKDGGTSGFASFVGWNRGAGVGVAVLVNGGDVPATALGERVLDAVLEVDDEP